MMRVFALAAVVLMTIAAPQAMAQTTKPPAASHVAQPLTPDEAKAITRKLRQVNDAMQKEYLAYMYQFTRDSVSTVPNGFGQKVAEQVYGNQRLRPVELPRNVSELTPRLAELAQQRTALEAQLAAAKAR